MSYYSSNELLDFQVWMNGQQDKIIMRKAMYPFKQIGLKNAPILIENLNELKESENRNGTAHTLDRSPAPTTSARSCTHTDCCGDCTETAITWTPIVAKNICISTTRGMDNMFDTKMQLNNAIWNRILDMYRDLELTIYAYVVANQTTIHNGVAGLGGWNADIWRVAIADRLQYINYVHQMMLANNYNGFMLDMVNSLSIGAEYQYVNQQGTGNSLNLQWQDQGMTMWQSTDIAVTANYRGDSFVIPEGGLAIVPWIPKINRENTGIMGGAAGYWTSMPSPFGDGIDIAVHITESCSDTSQSNGAVQDYVRNYELSFDVAVVSTPLAGAETPIFHTGLFAT